MTEKAPHKRKNPATEADTFQSAIEAFQQATDMRVCVKIFDQGLRYDDAFAKTLGRYMLHKSPFCLEVKRTRNEQCKECDLRHLPIRCEKEKEPFAHTCHAGADEIIIPLRQDETLIGLGYIGQFRTTNEQPAALPQLKPADRTRLMGLAQMLSAYLTKKLSKPRFAGTKSDIYRAELIHSYLEANLHKNPSLSELAGHMNLSATRVAHIIREVTNRSFTDLKDEMRLSRARDLLRFTYHKIAYIADRCGFSTSQYCHRFFKQKTGMTPKSYRMQHQADV